MSDICVTVPRDRWQAWLDEGDLPGDPASEYESHFTVRSLPLIAPGERVYIVAHGRLRGYAPLVRTEHACTLFPGRSCLVRAGGAVAVTIAAPIQGFQGWRYRFWERDQEEPFPSWQEP